MRTLLRAWMFAVMATVLVSGSGTAAQPPAKDLGQAPGILPSGFGEAVDRDIMTIRDATARFKTTEAAEAAGYQRVTGCVQHQPAGAMGYHFQNNTLLDTTLDLEHPEVLVYEKLPDGTFQLNGVEFLVPIPAWKSTEPPRIMGQALKKADPLGIWYLHVWTWKPSPSGLFADWNPDVKCLEAASMSQAASVPYPDEFRRWVHVGTGVLMPGANPQLMSEEGMRHIFANQKAVDGYSSGDFPDGSIIVYELRETQQKNGVIFEGERKRVDMMVKDSSQFKNTGGWRFERFWGNDQAQNAVHDAGASCFQCHSKANPHGFVFSQLH